MILGQTKKYLIFIILIFANLNFKNSFSIFTSMKRASIHKLFVITTRILIFLITYVLIHAFISRLLYFEFKNLISIFLAITLFIVIDNQLNTILKEVYLRLFFPDIQSAYNALSVYNQKLNSLLKKEQIQDSFLYFFQKHALSYQWSIYWLKEEYFELIGANNVSDNLPQMLKVQDLKTVSTLLKIKDLYKSNEILKLDKSLDELLNHFPWVQNDILFIPIQSKRNFTGFIFIEKQFNSLLEFDKFHEIFFRIIRKTSDVSEKANLYYNIYLQKVQSEKLLEISKLLTSTLNLDEVLDRIMKATKTVVPYDAGAIFLVDRQKDILEYKYSIGYAEENIKRIKLKINQGIVGKVIQTGKPSVIPDVSLSREYFPLRETTKSQLTVPIFIGEKTIGAIALESDRINNFTHSELIFLQNIVGHASIAISNAWLYEDVLKKREMEDDLLNAANVQKALLIQRIPRFEKLDISMTNMPAKIVGGDFYDIQKLDDQHLFVSIGDVSGKGASGAILMAVCLAALRSFTKIIYSVCEITAKLNNLLYETTSSNKYVTFFQGYIDTQKGEIIYTNAGHNPPILLKENGTVIQLKKGGMVLGFRKNISFIQEKIPFEVGDVLVLYTDGIVETKNVKNEEFGLERLLSIVKKEKKKSVFEIKETILKEVKNFSNREELEDDITLLILKKE